MIEFIPVIASFFTAWVISYGVIPSIINISTIKHLVDIPDSRKSHDQVVSRLGGIAIVAGWLITISFWVDARNVYQFQYLICAAFILFLTGVKDDLIEMRAFKKLLLQMVSASLLVIYGNYVVKDFGNAFGLNSISLWIAYPLSLLAIIGITNAFNLIDGINTLCSGIGILSSLVFGTYSLFNHDLNHALIAYALAGSLTGFFPYNRSPARIFMGDTGSMVVGLLSSVLAINFVKLSSAHHIKNAPLVAIGVLIIPIFDTIRVFTLRILHRRSPFKADRNHLHHLLLECGLSHMQAAMILISFNAIVILVCFTLYKYGHYLAVALTGTVFLMTLTCYFLAKRFDPARLWGDKVDATELDKMLPLPFPARGRDEINEQRDAV